ncbi:ankyrin repeat domain-containing protein [Actinoplanes sp. G11-F43]|uniref:ankyrin repeat domain-containing protein n=1 Tax=Actinoplanes sp. G11-F43 TaxID=3424130 RepID=UPI003D33A330
MSGHDPAALAEWQRIRRYAVPERMITEGAAARADGDWRRACAAGDVDVLIDDAGPVRHLLAGFAPDLLRWHIPRALGGYTAIAVDTRYVLVPGDGTVGPADPALVVDSPASLFGSQRLTLRAVPWEDLADEMVIPVPAHLWDARHATGLRTALGGSAERMPGFAPDGTPLPDDALGIGDDPPARTERVHRRDTLAAAFTEAGAEILGEWTDRDLAPVLDPARVIRLARELTARIGTGEWALWIDHHICLHIVVDDSTVWVEWKTLNWSDRDSPLRDLHRIDTALTRRAVDLDLIRAGRLTAGQLHPLVRAALFPGVPASGPSDPVSPEPVRVRCHGRWHEIGVDRGRLALTAHTEEERRRERAMRAFGGAVTGCFAVEQTWSGTAGRLPERLRAHREDLWQRMLHGGTRAVLELLDDGMDPHLRDSRGRTLMHRLRSYDHRVLFPRLLAAGLDIGARDLEGSTPLFLAVVYQAPADLIIALVDAGADPHAPNQDGMSVVDYLDDVLDYREDLDPDFATAVAHIRERA